eukprot:COSAG05_NODE_23224_length_259_cov_0.818750_1_plen_27_part_01
MDPPIASTVKITMMSVVPVMAAEVRRD